MPWNAQEALDFFKDPGLYFSVGLIGIAFLVSLFQGLKLERDLLSATFRGFVQLTLIGFALIWIFSFRDPWIIAVTLVAMVLLAGSIAGKRGRGIPHAYWIVAGSLFVTLALTLGLLLLGKVVPLEARYLIPLGGMIIGNSMTGAGLTLDRLKSEMNLRRGEVLVYLSLGATARESVQDILHHVLRASLIPAIDTMKALGVIFMPGMMAGLIIAGKSPLVAVRYQLIVMFMLLSAAALTNLFVLLLGYRQFFTKQIQLKRLAES